MGEGPRLGHLSQAAYNALQNARQHESERCRALIMAVTRRPEAQRNDASINLPPLPPTNQSMPSTQYESHNLNVASVLLGVGQACQQEGDSATGGLDVE